MEKLTAVIEITDEMKEARINCGEDSECDCPCRLGEDDCIWHYVSKEAWLAELKGAEE